MDPKSQIQAMAPASPPHDHTQTEGPRRQDLVKTLNLEFATDSLANLEPQLTLLLLRTELCTVCQSPIWPCHLSPCEHCCIWVAQGLSPPTPGTVTARLYPSGCDLRQGHQGLRENTKKKFWILGYTSWVAYTWEAPNLHNFGPWAT